MSVWLIGQVIFKNSLIIFTVIFPSVKDLGSRIFLSNLDKISEIFRPAISWFWLSFFISENFFLSKSTAIGSISEFGRNTTGEVGVFSRTKKQSAYAKVNIRLVDVSTGQLIYSEEGAGEAFSEVGTVMGAGTQAGYDSSLNDKVISAAISKLVNNIIENLTEKPWRSYILSVKDGVIVIAGGKTQGIMIGDNFNIFKKGQIVTNPQTGMKIELPGELIGKVKITQTVGTNINDEICFAKSVVNKINVSDFKNYYVEEISSNK